MTNERRRDWGFGAADLCSGIAIGLAAIFVIFAFVGAGLFMITVSPPPPPPPPLAPLAWVEVASPIEGERCAVFHRGGVICRPVVAWKGTTEGTQ